MRTSAGTDIVHVASLTKRYRSGSGISDVSLSVPACSITGFVGVNGAGKSTTLRCIVGLLQPDAGRVALFGSPATAEARRRIGFLPEERGLFSSEQVRDAIAFYGRLKGMARRAAYASADTLLERIGLGAQGKARIGTLSKGNMQRVQLLCALVHDPKLLLLDEPLSGLDPMGQTELLSLFAEFRSKGGAILFSSHSMAAVENICDRVIVLSGGQVVYEGSTADVAMRAPHGVIVVTTDAAGLTAAASAIGGEVRILSAGSDAVRYQVQLPLHVTHPVLMRALADHAVPILDFRPIKQDLEGAFWTLSKDEAAATRRESLAA